MGRLARGSAALRAPAFRGGRAAGIDGIRLTILTEQPTLSQSLIDAWPMQVTGLHRLEFENGRVVLTLAIGELESMLPKIWLRADAFYLRLSQVDAKLAYIAKALARIAGDQATLCAEAHPLLPQALKDAGFI